MKKNLKSHSIGARISDEVYDWVVDKQNKSGHKFSMQVSLILEDAMIKDKKKSK